jgi:ABC-type polysaccharide/polyol phosphate transport system ATPase subunit
VALVIESRELSKRFLLRHNPAGELKVRMLAVPPVAPPAHREFWALRSISLKIDEGEALAMIGRNGSGKSTFLKIVAAFTATSGDLLVAEGTRIGSMIELGTGFHPELTGRRTSCSTRRFTGCRRQTPWVSTMRSSPTRGSSTSWTCR